MDLEVNFGATIGGCRLAAGDEERSISCEMSCHYLMLTDIIRYSTRLEH
jgi:hypothetical protein